MINKCIKGKNKTCKEFNSEKNGVNTVNKNQQKIPTVSNFPKFVFRQRFFCFTSYIMKLMGDTVLRPVLFDFSGQKP